MRAARGETPFRGGRTGGREGDLDPARATTRAQARADHRGCLLEPCDEEFLRAGNTPEGTHRHESRSLWDHTPRNGKLIVANARSIKEYPVYEFMV